MKKKTKRPAKASSLINKYGDYAYKPGAKTISGRLYDPRTGQERNIRIPNNQANRAKLRQIRGNPVKGPYGHLIWMD